MFEVTGFEPKGRLRRPAALAISIAVAIPAVACAQSAPPSLQDAAVSIDAYLTNLEGQGFDGVFLIAHGGKAALRAGHRHLLAVRQA